MRIAHVRERDGPEDAPWRLAVALDSGLEPGRWLDVERARRRLLDTTPALQRDVAALSSPLSTLDDLLARGLRIAALGEVLDRAVATEVAEGDAVLESAGLRFGPPVLHPPSIRDGFGFEAHVRMAWEHHGGTVPPIWYQLPVFYLSNTSEIRGPDDPVWAPRGSEELDFELEVAALVDTPAIDLTHDSAEGAIGGYTVFNDWSARDLQRDETTLRLGPAKGKDFASSFGPWLVTSDELEDVRTDRAFDLAMVARVNGEEVSRGRWSDAVHGFGALIARASADVHLRAGDLFGSGTVGTGCLLEVRQATIGRYLQPGDVVELEVERLGVLRTPIVERPAGSR